MIDMWVVKNKPKSLRPWAWLKIGKDVYIHDPDQAETKKFKYLKSFEMSYMGSNGMQWLATVFDEEGKMLAEIGAKLSAYLDVDIGAEANDILIKATMKVGWAGSDGTKESEAQEFSGIVSDVKPSFGKDGVSYQIAGTCLGTLFGTFSASWNFSTGDIKDSVEQLLKAFKLNCKNHSAYFPKVQWGDKGWEALKSQLEDVKEKRTATGSSMLAVIRDWLIRVKVKTPNSVLALDSNINTATKEPLRISLAKPSNGNYLFGGRTIQVGYPNSKTDIPVLQFEPELSSYKLLYMLMSTSVVGKQVREAVDTSKEKPTSNACSQYLRVPFSVSSAFPAPDAKAQAEAFAENMKNYNRLAPSVVVGLQASLTVAGEGNIRIPDDFMFKTVDINYIGPNVLEGRPARWLEAGTDVRIFAGEWFARGITQKVSESDGFTTTFHLLKSNNSLTSS